ncbi:MAG: DUF1360 domain-containing protein [Sphingobacteriales bacterium]|nr:DUF1360 domain-containing protein [Sphingobacteriales bacterium]
MDVFLFIVTILAVWRITHLLSKEDGPFDIVFLIRKKAGAGFLGSLLDCFYCTSVWIALPFGLWLGNNWWEKLLYWWAISGSACLLEQATTKSNQQKQEPEYFED